MKPGQRCPKCGKGKIYRIKEPAVLVRITGQAPLQATVYEMERWRCNLCGEVFTAEAPEEVGPAKWDEAAASMVGLLKYGTGMPFHRLEQLQKSLGIPLPASTQWEMVKEAAEAIEPAWEELIRQAAQGEVLHNDDTTAVILESDPGAAQARTGRGSREAPDPGERTGTFTTGIVSVVQGAQDRAVFHGPSACGRKPEGRPAEAGGGTAAADPDVRRAVAQRAGAARRAQGHSLELQRAREKAVRGCGLPVSRGVPLRARSVPRRLS